MINTLKKIVRKAGLRNLVYPIYKATFVKRAMENQRKKFSHSNLELLLLTKKILNNKGWEFWLNYGTLLGAYRDNDFIPHDYDLDIGMYWKDREGVKEAMIEGGLKLMYVITYGNPENYDSLEYRFEYKGCYIDINFYEVKDGVATTYNPVFISQNDYNKTNTPITIEVEQIDNPFTGISGFKFKGYEFSVPKNTEEYIIANYGKNYRTPIKDFNYLDYATNITKFSLEQKSGLYEGY